MASFSTLLSVAGLCCKIQSKDSSLIDLTNLIFKDFISKNNPDFFLKINRMQREVKVSDNLHYSQLGLEGKSSFRLYDSVLRISHNAFFGEFDLKKNTGSFSIAFPKTYSMSLLKSIARTVFAFKLLENNAFLLHSVGLLFNGKALVFAGEASSGKSTIARFSLHCKILNDEIIAIKKIGSKVFAFGTPFGGEFAPSNKNAELNKIFFLKKAKKNKVVRLSPVEVTINALKNEFVFYSLKLSENKQLLRKLFKLVSGVMQDIEGFELYFLPNKSFWKEIKKLSL